MSVSEIVEESIMVPLDNGHQLHIRRLCGGSNAPPVLMLHGLLEDGTVFYSRSKRGLAYSMASAGFDVYIPDLRGKGRSWPHLSEILQYRVYDAVTSDIPTLLEAISTHCGSAPKFWVAHGWGGVLLTSFLARYPQYRSGTLGLVYFGTRRVASTQNLQRRVFVDALWGWLAGAVSKLRGFIPGGLLKMGPSDEFSSMRSENIAWMQGASWVDPSDKFDYGAALSEGLEYPPSLYIASKSDLTYGNPRDVSEFMREVGSHNGRLIILDKEGGSQHNYRHSTMLTHPDAATDHFPLVLSWMEEMICLKNEAVPLTNTPPASSGVESP
ncbi:hypothetical protein A9Q99_26960 [Gammaproteobacteria bacterium 45_16_T64]|nr:hypothetical protein A9Q99_26960 [Gammaproteobacteria bacterium 45_16_T64]